MTLTPEIRAYLDFDCNHGAMSLVVSNIGRGTARDIKILCFDYSIAKEDFVPQLKKSFIENGIPVLVPGAERRTTVRVGENVRVYKDKSCNVEVSYLAAGFIRKSRKLSQEFLLDYYSFSGSIYPKSVESEIKSILEKIAAKS